MKMPSSYSRRSPLEISMTPMIDVVFLLLVFFVWTASFQMLEHLLPTSVSAANGSGTGPANQPPPPEADFDNVVVRILWDGNGPAWQINEQLIANLPALRTFLGKIASIKQDAPVILHPDRNVPLGHVIDVYDAARLARFQKVQFAASSESK